MGVAQAMNRDNRNLGLFTMARKDRIHRGVVDFIPCHKNWLIGGKPLCKFRELDNSLPVDLHLANG